MDLRQFGTESSPILIKESDEGWLSPRFGTSPFWSINLRTRSTLAKFPLSWTCRSRMAIFHVANKLTYLAHHASSLYFDVARRPDRMILMAIRSSRISGTFLINRDEICRRAPRELPPREKLSSWFMALCRTEAFRDLRNWRFSYFSIRSTRCTRCPKSIELYFDLWIFRPTYLSKRCRIKR